LSPLAVHILTSQTDDFKLDACQLFMSLRVMMNQIHLIQRAGRKDIKAVFNQRIRILTGT